MQHSHTKNGYSVVHFYVQDNGTFPNSQLPVIHYRGALRLPRFFKGLTVKRHFASNGWRNAWRYGIFTYHHYHSITHEVLGVIKGSTEVILGGNGGVKVSLNAGDVLIIPAGVAHKNLKGEKDLVCIGAYPGGSEFDMNYGKPGERPGTDRNIANVPMPAKDPVFGKQGAMLQLWMPGT